MRGPGAGGWCSVPWLIGWTVFSTMECHGTPPAPVGINEGEGGRFLYTLIVLCMVSQLRYYYQNCLRCHKDTIIYLSDIVGEICMI